MDYNRGKLYSFFAGDHDRIEDLFKWATQDKEAVDLRFYEQFRAGMVRHIGMEEKILIPAAQRAGGGEKLALAAKIRLDHGAIVALLVPAPIPIVLNALNAILTKHNELEERAEGLYELCEQLTENEIDDLLKQLREAPEVPMNPHQEPSKVLDATRRALARAGYNLDDYEQDASA